MLQSTVVVLESGRARALGRGLAVAVILVGSIVVSDPARAAATPSTFARTDCAFLGNNHVVADLDSVEVTLADGRKFTTADIRRDPKTDLALVKLDVKDALPFLEFGDSDAMEVGDRVLAVGAPFGLIGSVTSGIRTPGDDGSSTEGDQETANQEVIIQRKPAKGVPTVSMKRHLLLLGLYCSFLGCVAHSEDNWKEIAKAHQEAQKTGICEVHKIQMVKKAVPIHWGEAIPPSPGEPSYQYRMQHFPNYIEVIEGGCVKIPGKNSQSTFICSKCKEEAMSWKKGKK